VEVVNHRVSLFITALFKEPALRIKGNNQSVPSNSIINVDARDCRVRIVFPPREEMQGSSVIMFTTDSYVFFHDLLAVPEGVSTVCRL
jgi:hypothetical protein